MRMRPLWYLNIFFLISEWGFFITYENETLVISINFFPQNVEVFFWNTTIFYTLSIMSYFFERFRIVNILSIRSSFDCNTSEIKHWIRIIRIISTQNAYRLLVIVEIRWFDGLIKFSTLLMTLPKFYSCRLVIVATTENSRILISTG